MGSDVIKAVLIYYVILLIPISHSAQEIVIKRSLSSLCRSSAEFEWHILNQDDIDVHNCSIRYGPIGQKMIVDIFADVKSFSGHFNLENLTSGVNYSVQISCENSQSEPEFFIITGSECSESNLLTSNDEVVVFQETTPLLGTRDSVLGIVFGLFGFLIIIVTTFYIVRKIRRRRRLERIHAYLGSSMTDPFGNLNISMDQEMASARLIESADT